MQNIDQIEEWLGQEVTDADGERLGKLEEIFYSSRTGDAVFASIKSGLLGRHSSTAPLAGASVGRDYLRLAYTAEQIERLSGDVDAREALDGEDARRLGEAYGIVVAPEEEFEGATAVNARRAAAEETRRQAEALEADARARAAEAHDAQGAAQQADQDAARKAEEAEQARMEAEHARAESERTPPP